MHGVGTTLLVGPSPTLIEMATTLGREGERIGLLARTVARLRQCKQHLEAHDVDCEWFTADVSDAGAVLAAFKRFADWSPRLDRLIYNVGIASHEPAVDVTTSSLHNVMGANFFGLVNCLRLAHPMFKRTGGGHVLILSSARALENDQSVAYAASKASVRIYIAALRRELGESPIKFSEVYLGQMRGNSGWRDLTQEEIVSGVLSTIQLQPERCIIGEDTANSNS
jgi:hypothetical protein